MKRRFICIILELLLILTMIFLSSCDDKNKEPDKPNPEKEASHIEINSLSIGFLPESAYNGGDFDDSSIRDGVYMSDEGRVYPIIDFSYTVLKDVGNEGITFEVIYPGFNDLALTVVSTSRQCSEEHSYAEKNILSMQFDKIGNVGYSESIRVILDLVPLRGGDATLEFGIKSGEGISLYGTSRLTRSINTGEIRISYILNPDGKSYSVSKASKLVVDAQIPERNRDGLPITAIGKDAFKDCTLLEKVSLSDCITSIGSGAFSGCSALASINIPDSVIRIGSNAFFGCKGILSEENGVYYVGKWAVGCHSETEVIRFRPDTVGTSDEAFSRKEKLLDVAIEDSIRYIGTGAFQACLSLSMIEVSEGNLAYRSEDGILYTKDGKTLICYPSGKSGDDFTTPEGLLRIAENAFFGCDSLKSVTVGSSVEYIGSSAFSECNRLWYISLPFIGESKDGAKNTNLGYIFSGSSHNRGNDVPSSLKTVAVTGIGKIGNNAFYNCSSLESVIIGEGITSIGERAFAYCSGLSNIHIPAAVTNIGSMAFSGCTSLSEITVSEDNTVYTAIDGNLYSKDLKTFILYAPGKNGDSFDIPDGITSIAVYAFDDCSSLINVTIPDGVTSIGGSAFYGCSGLKSMTLPDSVTDLGADAFSRCTALAYVRLGNAVSDIKDFTFSNCSSLDNLVIPGSVSYIGNCAFEGCSSLTEIIIPNSVTSIGTFAFMCCIKLTSVKLSENITSIEPYAFAECKSLTELDIPDGVTSIGDFAFYKCTGLTEIIIPDGVTVIGESAYGCCTSLSSVTIPKSVTVIKSEAFIDCDAILEVFYTGSREEWSLIEMNGNVNYFRRASFVFDYVLQDADKK